MDNNRRRTKPASKIPDQTATVSQAKIDINEHYVRLKMLDVFQTLLIQDGGQATICRQYHF
jgi:hypothetical protein